MSFQDDVNTSNTLLESDLRAAGSNQTSVNTAYANHYKRLVAAEEAWPGNSAGALNEAIRLDPTTNSRGHKK